MKTLIIAIFMFSLVNFGQVIIDETEDDIIILFDKEELYEDQEFYREFYESNYYYGDYYYDDYLYYEPLEGYYRQDHYRRHRYYEPYRAK